MFFEADMTSYDMLTAVKRQKKMQILVIPLFRNTIPVTIHQGLVIEGDINIMKYDSISQFDNVNYISGNCSKYFQNIVTHNRKCVNGVKYLFLTITQSLENICWFFISTTVKPETSASLWF